MSPIKFLRLATLVILVQVINCNAQTTYDGLTDTDIYVKNIVPTTFGKTQLNNEADKKDFKKLREFLRNKSDLLVALSEKKELYFDNSESIRILIQKEKKIENIIKNEKPDKIVQIDEDLIDLNLPSTGSSTIQIQSFLNQLNNVKKEKISITVDELRDTHLENIKSHIEKLKEKSNAFKNLDANIRNVKQDIYDCNSQIDSTLAPEYQQQNFRIWISICFTILIAILLLIFFFIVYKKSDQNLSKELLSGNGLQFITLFVLIIAIILFGILNILGGTELATILSGISGYILGKGINNSENKKLIKRLN